MTSTTTRSVASPTPAADTSAPTATLADQAPILLGLAAGYVGHRTVAIGLRTGLIQALASRADGVAIDELAELLDLDPFYVCVWVQSAVANGVCDQADDHVRLAAHLSTLLLDTTSPAYVGGVFPLLEQDEIFDRFERELGTGRPDVVGRHQPRVDRRGGRHRHAVLHAAGAGRARAVPGLAERLEAVAGSLTTPAAPGSDSRAWWSTTRAARSSVSTATSTLSTSREPACRLPASATPCGSCIPLEQMRLDAPAALVVNNISMHECRDMDEVAAAVYEALEPGGWFVISDFPFPDTTRAADRAGSGDERHPVLRGADRRPAAAAGAL